MPPRTPGPLAAVAQAGGVDRALGPGQLHVHRHIAVLVGLVRARLDVDHAEVVQLGQRLPQAVQLALVVVAALVPVHQRIEQLVDEVVLLEAHRAHVVAAAAVPGQVDVGGIVGAGDLHLALGVVGIEVTTLGQAPGDGDLAGFVLGVLEALALARLERGQVILQVLVVHRRAGDVDVLAAHGHRGALVDVDQHADVLVLARRLDLDHRVVVAERFQCLAGLPLGLGQQVFQARFALFLADRVVQRQRFLDVLDDCGVVALVQSLDVHLVDGAARVDHGGGGQRQDHQRQGVFLWLHAAQHTDRR